MATFRGFLGPFVSAYVLLFLLGGGVEGWSSDTQRKPRKPGQGRRVIGFLGLLVKAWKQNLSGWSLIQWGFEA